MIIHIKKRFDLKINKYCSYSHKEIKFKYAYHGLNNLDMTKK